MTVVEGGRDERVRCSRLKREIENDKKIEFDLRFALRARGRGVGVEGVERESNSSK